MPRLCVLLVLIGSFIIAMLVVSAASAGDGAGRSVRPHSGTRIGVCRQYGPRGGCVRWSHRRIHHAPWPIEY